MEVPELYHQLMILRFLFGLMLNLMLKCLNVTNPHIKLTKQLFTLPHTQQLFNHTDASTLDLIMNKEVELKILFLLLLILMELELLPLNTTKLTIKIKNGSSMIETGLSITDLIQTRELIH